MNQFTTTAIINSLDAFKKAFKVDPKHVVEVFRHDGRWGRKETVAVDLSKLTFSTPAPEVIRFEIRLNTVGAQLSAFQNALTRNAEQFTYEVKYNATTSTMATDLEKVVNGFGYKYGEYLDKYLSKEFRKRLENTDSFLGNTSITIDKENESILSYVLSNKEEIYGSIIMIEDNKKISEEMKFILEFVSTYFAKKFDI